MFRIKTVKTDTITIGEHVYAIEPTRFGFMAVRDGEFVALTATRDAAREAVAADANGAAEPKPETNGNGHNGYNGHAGNGHSARGHKRAATLGEAGLSRAGLRAQLTKWRNRHAAADPVEKRRITRERIRPLQSRLAELEAVRRRYSARAGE